MASGATDGAGSSGGTAERRSWWAPIGFGLLAGALVGFALVGLIAAPLFLWAAATEPGVGLQRPFVRHGLRSAPYVGLAGFALTTVLSTGWRRRHPTSAERATMAPDG
jgi:hypothetical protein